VEEPCAAPRTATRRAGKARLLGLAVIVAVFTVWVVQPPVEHVVRVALVYNRLVAAAGSVNMPVDMIHTVVLVVSSHNPLQSSWGFQ